MKVDLSGLRALVTGSTKGIGRAIAHALAKNGAEVAINGRKPADVEQAIAAIRATLPTARLVPAPGDAATAQGVAAIIKAAGDVDILVNNVGIFEIKNAFDIPDEDWQRLFATNVLSGVRFTRHYGPRMRDKGFGRIVFISSESGVQIPTEMIHYGFTKSADLALMRGFAVLPGPTRAEGVEAMFKSMGRSLDDPKVERSFIDSGERDDRLAGAGRWRRGAVDYVATLRPEEPLRGTAVSREILQPSGQLLELPLPRQRGRLRPGRLLIFQTRHGRLAVHGGDRTVEPQIRGLFGKPAGFQDCRQAAVLPQQRGRASRADAGSAGQLVRRVAPQRDEIRHLLGLDAIAGADLRGTDARHLAGADRIEDRRVSRGELERVAIAAGHQHGATAPLLGGSGGGEEIVGLVAGALCIGKAAGGDEVRDERKLLQ